MITDPQDFTSRHIGITEKDKAEMLKVLGYQDMNSFVTAAVPEQIRAEKQSDNEESEGLTESQALEKIASYASQNQIWRSYIGQGFYGCLTPSVIKRDIVENPGWYTQYTPYQPEISQGRLEALFVFQTLISELTGLPVANSSLLDEASAAAEAMQLSHAVAIRKRRKEADTFLVSDECFESTISVVRTRAEALGLKVEVSPVLEFSFSDKIFGCLLQNPGQSGVASDYSSVVDEAHKSNILVTVAADLMALTLLKTPGDMGADIAVGTTQRFGCPVFYGGPHAAYFATREEYQRQAPGRVVGASVNKEGKKAYRLALQTREQHIRREKATSNICTAQVLLAIVSTMYAVYHGPEGLKKIASRINSLASLFAAELEKRGLKISTECFFDTVKVEVLDPDTVRKSAEAKEINLLYGTDSVSVSFDETMEEKDLQDLLEVFTGDRAFSTGEARKVLSADVIRKGDFLIQEVFNLYHSETEFMRYVKRLESKDLSLTASMIPLGSCTMKLNAASEMEPVTWPGFSSLHPYVPQEQAKGYQQLISDLEQHLISVTGFSAVSFQPNAGSQGEYAGLLIIRKYHQEQGDSERDICLIPASAHGTNPASAVMAGYKVVTVACDGEGNIDLDDLNKKIEVNSDRVAALMITYPSTHGVFEEAVKSISKAVHQAGGQVYMDGANLNAQIGLMKPRELGADVMHFNLHKTFSIPHGGGGPGVGPVAVAEHLKGYLPGHAVVSVGSDSATGAVAAAPWGSAGVLPISWMYCEMMGVKGLGEATEIALLNANYIASRLDKAYPVLYRGQNGLVAHECIVDLRHFKKTSGVEVEDVAKRLMDYGFHAPTVSFPVPGTLMIEPTESESLYELDRFITAMLKIREEITAIENGDIGKDNNLLKNAPHTAEMVTASEWSYPYSREEAAYPVDSLRDYKFWPASSRIDNAYGDRNFCCRS